MWPSSNSSGNGWCSESVRNESDKTTLSTSLEYVFVSFLPETTKIMDCQLFPFIFTKIKVMKRDAWASQTTVISSFVCWPCTMPVSRHSCEDPLLSVLNGNMAIL